MAEFLLSENKGDVQIKCEHLLTFIRESQEDAREHQENYWLRHLDFLANDSFLLVYSFFCKVRCLYKVDQGRQILFYL